MARTACASRPAASAPSCTPTAVAPGPATLALRPHRLRLTPPGEGVLPAECRRVAYLGSRIEYVVATPWGELLIFDSGARKPLDRGAAVGVAFDPEAAIVLPRVFS